MKIKTSTEKGFERQPVGALLEQVIDIQSPMGIAYERSFDFYKDFHTHERLMFICPRGSCQMEVREESSQRKFFIDESTIMSVPPIISHDDEAISSIYDTFALYPEKMYLLSSSEKLNISRLDFQNLYKECRIFKRSEFLERTLQEYFFKRIIIKENRELKEIKELEENILAEILSLIYKRSKSKIETRELPVNESAAQRAKRFIETNLFSDLTLKKISKTIGCSVSVLGKKFKADFAITPNAYIRNRRLEEARNLLEKTSYSVSEVALIVGYSNFGAFSEAFSKKFKKPPRLLRPK
jgi:AraC-like DNA-binding protein